MFRGNKFMPKNHKICELEGAYRQPISSNLLSVGMR